MKPMAVRVVEPRPRSKRLSDELAERRERSRQATQVVAGFCLVVVLGALLTMSAVKAIQYAMSFIGL